MYPLQETVCCKNSRNEREPGIFFGGAAGTITGENNIWILTTEMVISFRSVGYMYRFGRPEITSSLSLTGRVSGAWRGCPFYYRENRMQDTVIQYSYTNGQKNQTRPMQSTEALIRNHHIVQTGRFFTK